MRYLALRAALCATLLSALCGQTAGAVDAAQQAAPNDGWASQAGGTTGGSAATSANIYTVSNRTQLLNAITNGGAQPKIIKVVGIIDMSEGVPFASHADQATRGAVNLKSNTTLIGDGTNSGFTNAFVTLINVSQIIIRNLKLVNPCDVSPVYDATDGAGGSYNSQFDGISIKGSDHIWIDHNSFTDAPVTDDTLPVDTSVNRLKQCHDGALDITDASDYVTISFNNFSLHNKNNLIGNSDSASGDTGHLRVTFSNNVFSNVTQRAPRVRYGQVHLFNNYYVGSQTHPVYPNDYSIGAGYASQLISDNNVFEITFTGKAACDKIIVNPNSSAVAGKFKDTGSLLNGTALSGCSLSSAVTWTIPYAYTPRASSLVKLYSLLNAGGGKLTTAISGTGNTSSTNSSSSSSSTSSTSSASSGCTNANLYFCDDFETGSADKWDLLPVNGPNGTFSVVADPSGAGNVLQYTAQSTGGILALVKTSAFTGVTSPDYYVEARIRPMTNSTTSNKYLFLVTRYVDANNWYGAGLNVQSSTSSTNVEIAKMLAGTLTRPKQTKKPIAMDAQFYTVRFEVIGTNLSVYLDGEKIGAAIVDSAFASRGLIGLYTANKSFMIDDVKVGDPAIKPVQLTLSTTSTTWAAEAGDTPLTTTVTALKNDGVTADTFSVVSSNPAAVAASKAGNVVTLTPVGEGTSTITFTSGSDSTVTRTITATIAPQFVQSTETYNLSGVVSPAAGEPAAYIDGSLKLVFDTPPTLGAAGSIRIFRKSDNALVDVIKPSSETDSIGYTGQDQIRKVNFNPIKIAGNTVTITPHNNKLAYGTEYYVAIANGVFTGTSLNGNAFLGIGLAGNWSFTTKPAVSTSLTTLAVNDDGIADFRTVQGALNHLMKNVAKATPVTINVMNGTYEELLFIRAKDNVTIKGESRDGTVIQYKNYETLNGGSGASQAAGSGSAAGGRAVLLIETSDLLTLDTLTLKNTTLRSSSISAQAETLYFNNDAGRLIAKNANFFSEQDTIQVKGYSWFYNTLIAGNVDFIWGSNRVALFENSEIRSVGDTSNASSGGYLVQARTVAATDKGFVFLNSSLTQGVGPGGVALPSGVTYLARSPGGTSSWDNVSFINCKMDTHVAPVGWAYTGVNGQPAPNPVTATAASGWREYGTTDLAGTPLNLATRVGGYALNASDVVANFSTRAQIFSAFNSGAGWNPAP
ncbi:pectinesterase family protein [Uliginosibacterium sp. H3]|uniref:Pectinesterase family protein n=1 Tax=Uliginosibacterium silvisoli TaxID=3114758 RepID=A0ABU6K393_9RHOO|nr:pectinesterase family protein [Uliginosibacterium sp. H3]